MFIDKHLISKPARITSACYVLPLLINTLSFFPYQAFSFTVRAFILLFCIGQMRAAVVFKVNQCVFLMFITDIHVKGGGEIVLVHS